MKPCFNVFLTEISIRKLLPSNYKLKTHEMNILSAVDKEKDKNAITSFVRRESCSTEYTGELRENSLPRCS